MPCRGVLFFMPFCLAFQLPTPFFFWLVFTEANARLFKSCFGNMATAETHFDGLLTLLGLYLLEGRLDTLMDFDEELTTRYLVL